MTNSQTQFQKDEALLGYWTAIAMTDNFQKVITFARAAILEGGGLTPDMLAGVNLLATTLVTMVQTQEETAPNYNIGLVHDLQPKRRTAEPKKKE